MNTEYVRISELFAYLDKISWLYHETLCYIRYFIQVHSCTQGASEFTMNEDESFDDNFAKYLGKNVPCVDICMNFNLIYLKCDIISPIRFGSWRPQIWQFISISGCLSRKYLTM